MVLLCVRSADMQQAKHKGSKCDKINGQHLRKPISQLCCGMYKLKCTLMGTG